MAIIASIQRHRTQWCIAAATLTVAAGDVLFYRYAAHGGQIGFGLAALLLLAVAVRPVIWRDPRALLAAGVALVFAGQMVRAPGLLAWTLFWVAAGMAVLLPATGRFDDGWRWFQRLIAHAARSVVAPILDAVRWRKARVRRPDRRLKLSSGIAALALPVTGSIVIALLFISANPVLERLVDELTTPGDWELDIPRLLLWTALLFAAWSLLHPKHIHPLFGTFDGSGDLALPGVSVTSVRTSLIAFNLLFAGQNAMDLAYLSGLAPMPAGITLAEYAHRGAYPLIVTALLAALFVLVTLRPGSETAARPVIRWLVVIWVVQNLILVASSIVRTIDYIDAYSLTTLRIEALAWMLLVGCGLVLICWRMLTARSARWLVNSNCAAAAVMLTGFAIVDTDAIAASWNVRHAREVGGHGTSLDLCYLNILLDDSALPALIELERRPELTPALRDRVRYVRNAVLDRLDNRIRHGGWSLLGEQRRLDARASLAHMPKSPPLKAGSRTCSGEIYDVPAPPPPSTPLALGPAPAPAAKSALTAEQRP